MSRGPQRDRSHSESHLLATVAGPKTIAGHLGRGRGLHALPIDNVLPLLAASGAARRAEGMDLGGTMVRDRCRSRGLRSWAALKTELHHPPVGVVIQGGAPRTQDCFSLEHPGPAD